MTPLLIDVESEVLEDTDISQAGEAGFDLFCEVLG
jgi:hypothetical protein